MADIRRGAMRRTAMAVVAGILAIAFLAAAAPIAWAHLALVRSSPPAGARLTRPPAAVVLTFTEAPDPSLSSIELLDSAGKSVTARVKARPMRTAPPRLRLALPPMLADGAYTVSWRMVDAADGHVTAGTYSFRVAANAASPTAATGPSSVAPSSSPSAEASLISHGEGDGPQGLGGDSAGTPTWLSAASAAGRWLLYLGLALAVGSATSWLVHGPIPVAGGAALLRLAWVAAAAGALVTLLAERAVVGTPSLLPLLQSDVGKNLAVQGSAVIVLGVAVAAFSVWPDRRTLMGVGAIGALAMLAHCLTSHANASSAYRLATLMDAWIHMTAVGLWIGGLAWLVLALRGLSRPERVALVRRFSRLAGYALAVVVVTGTVRALTEMDAPRDLVGDAYGRTLLAKVALVGVVAALGALNRFRLVPALAHRADVTRDFSLAVRVEILLALGVLAATAVLSGLAPG